MATRVRRMVSFRRSAIGEQSPISRTIAFVSNENGIGKLHLLDVATGKEKPVPALPPGTIGSATWHENNVALAFDMDSAQSPNDVYSLNVRTGKVDRWTTSETGGVVTTDLQEPELVKWKSFDGMEISGFLYKPAAKFPTSNRFVRVKDKTPVTGDVAWWKEYMAIYNTELPGGNNLNSHYAEMKAFVECIRDKK